MREPFGHSLPQVLWLYRATSYDDLPSPAVEVVDIGLSDHRLLR